MGRVYHVYPPFHTQTRPLNCIFRESVKGQDGEGRGGVREGGWLWRRTFCLQFPNSIQIWTANDKLRSPRLAIGCREPTTNIVKDNRERPFSRQHCALYSGAACPRPPWSVGELRGTHRRQPVWWAATGPFSSLCPTV